MGIQIRFHYWYEYMNRIPSAVPGRACENLIEFLSYQKAML